MRDHGKAQTQQGIILIFFVSGRYGLPWQSVKGLKFRRTLLAYRTSGAHGTQMWEWPAGRRHDTTEKKEW